MTEGLTLEQYYFAVKTYCELNHQDCERCNSTLLAAREILKEIYISLPALWRKVRADVPYDCEKAQRWLLRLPITVLSIKSNKENFLYVIEKSADVQFYDKMITCITQAITVDNTAPCLNKAEFEKILNLADHESEREVLKHAAAALSNTSRRKAKTFFGISRLKERAVKVGKGILINEAIKRKNHLLCVSEQRSYLSFIGVDASDFIKEEHIKSIPDNSNTDSSESEEDSAEDSITESSKDDADDTSTMEEKKVETDNFDTNNTTECSTAIQIADENPESCETISITQNEVMQTRSDSLPTCRSFSLLNANKNCPLLDVNSVIVLDILKEADYNWYAFVSLLQPRFEEQGYTVEVFDQFLTDFASQLPHLGLTQDDERLVDQSKTAYLEDLRQREMRTEDISEEPSDEYDESDASVNIDPGEIVRKLENIKAKWRWRTKKEIASHRIMKRKTGKGKCNILTKFPDIGEVIEDIVEKADVGADRWRRTGVYTFSGDPKKEKRLTFSLLQKKLCEHYNTHFSYGSVVELCLPRNKRSSASKCYKGAANIKYRRARKGFSVKFNPDKKWSRSFYKALTQLQCDGNHILLLNRDDQAGFRLDTTYTHKTQKVLAKRNSVTTFTDFLNKHQTLLQTTSYNFSKTNTTTDVCLGIVKASAVHQKSASQHMADLQMIEKEDVCKGVFYHPVTEKPKEIECVRVDGASDENPSHAEIQFLWTERHVTKPTRITLVTTRSSGDSFLNRVELQNGCLALGHSNLFIPSTLRGDWISENGEFSDIKYKENMEAALNQYILRVDQTPCMNTNIHLFEGQKQDSILERRKKLITFLRGSKREIQKLKNESPEMLSYFESIWKVRSNHSVETIANQYIFFLRCCGKEDCPHPYCRGMK